jgi:hypothetical protein
MTRFRWYRVSRIGAFLLLLRSSAAAESTAVSAVALFEQGRNELAAGKYESACNKLRQSDELDPAPGTKLNLGECEALRGRVATAWELFRRVESQLLADDVRLPIAKSKREAIEPRLPRLVVTLQHGVPSDARLHAGRRIIEPSEIGVPIALDPGPVEVVVTAPGYVEQRKLVTLAEGKTEGVDLAPARLPLTLPRASPMPPVAVARTQISMAQVVPRAVTTSPTKRAGVVVLGIGIGGAVVAGVAGLVTMDAKRINDENCPDLTQTCNATGRDAASRGRLFGPITTAGLIVGSAGIGIGTFLILTGGANTSNSASLSLRSDGVGSRLVFERAF